ncbi:RDD family protein [Arsukibacterium sp.]|uniref:RDD family protein n=1 Tax=Arsukibacterium sp. TaxID=1977258 RepID=UPI002FDB02C9
MFATAPRAGLARRLAAIIYDVLVLAAVVMLAAGLALLLVQCLVWLGLVSLAGYTDMAHWLSSGVQRWLYLGYLLSVIIGFFMYFWCKAGQTLGMRAWRLLVVQQNGAPLTAKQALLRAVLALAGLGNLWLLVRWGKGLALQDQLTDSQMIVLTKEQSKVLNLHSTAR